MTRSSAVLFVGTIMGSLLFANPTSALRPSDKSQPRRVEVEEKKEDAAAAAKKKTSDPPIWETPWCGEACPSISKAAGQSTLGTGLFSKSLGFQDHWILKKAIVRLSFGTDSAERWAVTKDMDVHRKYKDFVNEQGISEQITLLQGGGPGMGYLQDKDEKLPPDFLTKIAEGGYQAQLNVFGQKMGSTEQWEGTLVGQQGPVSEDCSPEPISKAPWQKVVLQFKGKQTFMSFNLEHDKGRLVLKYRCSTNSGKAVIEVEKSAVYLEGFKDED